MNKRLLLLCGLLVPFVGIIFLAGYKEFVINSGKEFTLKVRGFDPRDLLSGHYITYQIDFDIPGLCSAESVTRAVCLAADGNHFASPTAAMCDYPLLGECRHGRFRSGLERFYIPQAEAGRLDHAVRKGEGAIVVSVTPAGERVVKELLIQGQRWQNAQ
jgi:uncharacterized membrane-anchored protein